MIRVSAGTAACMELNRSRMDAFPTTAYLLSGNRCLMQCAFCPQGAGADRALSRLGRISWPEHNWEDVKKGLSLAEKKGVRRVCLQSVRHGEGIDPLLDTVTRLKDITDLPLSLSAWIGSENEAVRLIEAGAERISIALDVVDPGAFEKYKGCSQQERLKLLVGCSRSLPGRVSTHIICGLGETEFEALLLIDHLDRAGVLVALFAFVPLKGTPLQGAVSPPVPVYRRIQAGYYLLRNRLADFASFQFKNGRLVSYGLAEEELDQVLFGGRAFQTSGCPDCNRPYYNERPGGIIYNYPRELGAGEKEATLEELFSSLIL